MKKSHFKNSLVMVLLVLRYTNLKVLIYSNHIAETNFILYLQVLDFLLIENLARDLKKVKFSLFQLVLCIDLKILRRIFQLGLFSTAQRVVRQMHNK